MKLIRLLFLDSSNFCLWHLGDLKNRHPSESEFSPKRLLAEEDLNIGPGLRLEVIEAKSLTSKTCYDPDPELCEKVKDMTASGAVDVVVVGNNRGAGLERATAINADLRDRTIIVWDQYQPGHNLEKEYAALGFTHFCERRDLRKELKALLGLG